jgi:hypothetical protein
VELALRAQGLEVYGQTGYARAMGGSVLRVRRAGAKDEEAELSELPADERDSIAYLAAVVRGRKPGGSLVSRKQPRCQRNPRSRA